MLDLFGIMFSSIIMVLVVLRAVQLDTVQPWFKPIKQEADSSGLRLGPNSDKPGTALPPPGHTSRQVPRKTRWQPGGDRA